MFLYRNGKLDTWERKKLKLFFLKIKVRINYMYVKGGGGFLSWRDNWTFIKFMMCWIKLTFFQFSCLFLCNWKIIKFERTFRDEKKFNYFKTKHSKHQATPKNIINSLPFHFNLLKIEEKIYFSHENEIVSTQWSHVRTYNSI